MSIIKDFLVRRASSCAGLNVEPQKLSGAKNVVESSMFVPVLSTYRVLGAMTVPVPAP
jgi:hypothetical protein